VYIGELMAIGRISGQLLKSNLLRRGVDLAFETDLLYLNVVDSQIGVNKGSPTSIAGPTQYPLDVNGTTRTTDLIVDNTLTVGDFTISGNTIASDLSTITFAPSGGEPTIYHSRLQVNDIDITDNVISTLSTNADLEISPSGTGAVKMYSDATVSGNLTVTGNIDVTGNITIGGNLTIGDALTDNIVINASIKSSLIPESDNTYDLGSISFQWRTVYARNINADNLNSDTLDVGNIRFSNNVITTTPGTDLVIDPTGTGRVRLGNFAILDNTITNVSVNAVTVLAQTGPSAYFKINGTNGFRPPVGTVGQRPTAYMNASTVGVTRFNTESRALEVWDGLGWASPAGSSGAVSEIGASDIALRYVLTLG
jgi:hypothetical protein